MRLTASQINEWLGDRRERTIEHCTGLTARRVTEESPGWHGFTFSIRLYDKDRKAYLDSIALPGGTSFEEAHERYVEELAKVNRREHVVATGMTLGEVAVKAWAWLEEGGDKDKDYSERTILSYQDSYRLYIEKPLGSLALKKIDTKTLAGWRRKLRKGNGERMSNSTINNTLKPLAVIFKYAHSEGLISHRLAAIEPPLWAVPQTHSEGFKATVVREEDAQKIIDGLDDGVMKVGRAMTFWLGGRSSEIVAIRWCDLDFKENVAQITEQLAVIKGVTKRVKLKSLNSKREVPIAPYLREVLLDHLNSEIDRGFGAVEDYVLVSPRPNGERKPLLASALSKNIARAAREAKVEGWDEIDNGSQILRRSFCTMVATGAVHMEDANESDLAALTGHTVEVWRGSYVQGYQDAKAKKSIAGFLGGKAPANV